MQKPVPLSNQSLLRNSYTFTLFFSFGGLGTACAIIRGCRPPLYDSCEAVRRIEYTVKVLQVGGPRRTVSEKAERDSRHLRSLAPRTHASGGERVGLGSLYDERRLEIGRHVRTGGHWTTASRGRVDDNTVVEEWRSCERGESCIRK